MPCDIVAFASPVEPLGRHHDLLLANALAQAQALAFGRTEDELRAAGVPDRLVPHKVMPGNRPTTFLLLPRLTPFALGSLVALYEHVTFTQGAVWGIDSFDQWGVELGKELAVKLAPVIAGEEAPRAARRLDRGARRADPATAGRRADRARDPRARRGVRAARGLVARARVLRPGRRVARRGPLPRLRALLDDPADDHRTLRPSRARSRSWRVSSEPTTTMSRMTTRRGRDGT